MIIGECLFCKTKFRKREQKYKFCSLMCSSKFNKNGFKDIKLPEYGNLLSEFIGICLGDGYVSKYQIGITLNTIADKDYIAHVIKISQILFPGTKISLVKKGVDKAIDIRINSKKAADFLKEMGIVPKNKKIPKWILLSEDYKKMCMRGLFDTEGSISFKIFKGRRNTYIYKQLNFKNTNLQLIKFVRNTLKDIGLRPTMTLKKSIYISTHKDVDFFREIVGFSNPKLIKRSYINNLFQYSNLIKPIQTKF